jgi:nitrite reductase (NADH) small subunit
MTMPTASLIRPASHPPVVDEWVAVCPVEDLEVERGVAALVDGRQVAVFRTWDDGVHAVDHLDPFSGAHVIARGIVGTRGDAPTVASPMYKQVFDLRTGVCLDDASVRLPVHRVRVRYGVVHVALARQDGDGSGGGGSADADSTG